MPVDHINGDYFVDCGIASQSFLRSLFGVWISIYASVVAYCVRSIFRSKVIARLLSGHSRNGKVSLWVMSPATTPSGAYPLESTITDMCDLTCLLEAIQLRGLLLRAVKRGNVSFVTVSLLCVAATIVNAASTTITNHTVVKNVVIRETNVPGRLVQRVVRIFGRPR